MMKKAFGTLLVIATISLVFGQDLSAQIDEIDEKYDTNIKEKMENTYVNILKSFFGPDVEVVEKEK